MSAAKSIVSPDWLGFPLVRIQWEDSRGVTTGWEWKDDVDPLPPVVIFSVGYLIKDTKRYKTLVQSVSDEQILGRLTIPSGCIKSIKKLK